jgi:uncharacterized protein YeaO (DUF488 family)
MSQHICHISGLHFEITTKDLEFYQEVGPVVCGTKFGIPAPTLSPRERLRKRLAWRNERNLYRTKCALSGKSIVSSYSPDKPYKIADLKLWYQFDNTQFARDFDFTRPFFDQFQELLLETYKPNVSQNGEMENSEYCHFAGRLKNSYMAHDSGSSEDLQYSVFTGYSRDCIDCLLVYHSDLCYEGLKLENCYEIFYSSFCSGCSSSAWLTDCIGCSNCLGCHELRNKKYHIFNQAVTPSQFEQYWSDIFSGDPKKVAAFSKQYEIFLKQQLHRALRNIDSVNCSGDVLYKCENAENCFHCYEVRNIKHCCYVYVETESCYDVNTWGEGMQSCLELSGSGGMTGKTGIANCLFSTYLYYGAYDVLYSANCLDKCQNLFGCCDLWKKNYCILNKQYSKDDYEKLLYRILNHMQETGEWGEFFPLAIAPYGYNESIAQEELPLSKKEALDLGAKWSDYVSPPPQTKNILQANQIPTSCEHYRDELLESALQCAVSKSFYKLNKKELAFYKTHSLPIPRLAFLERHMRRYARLNPRQLYDARCAITGESIKTSYPPELGYKLLSEKAYQERMS